MGVIYTEAVCYSEMNVCNLHLQCHQMWYHKEIISGCKTDAMNWFVASTVQGAGDTKKVKKSPLCQEGPNTLAKVEITEIVFLFLNMGELKKRIL